MSVNVLDPQVRTWLALAERIGLELSEAELQEACELLPDGQAAPRAGGVAATLVVTRIDVQRTLSALTLPGRSEAGVLDRNHGPEGVAGYAPIAEIALPARRAYALVGVERGDELRGVPPRDAVVEILRRGRTPLTIDEGLALLVQHPALLERNHCFSLAGSRRGDRRVPALWISRSAPKLGWCWEGNPHDWLGCASTAGRVG